MAKKMTEGSIARTLITFSIPLIFSGLLQQLYSWADAFIVGNLLGETALAAIGATNSVNRMFVIGITGFTSGVSILSAQLYGKKQPQAQRKILFTFTVILGAIALLLACVGVPSAGALLRMMQTPTDIIADSRSYLQIILAGIPFLAVYNTYSAVLRGIGDSKAPFLAVLVSSLLNVVLDIAMVAVLPWGVTGAAIATLLSQVLMTVFIVLYAIRRYDDLRIRPDKALFDRAILTGGCKLALPITLQSMLGSIGSLMLQNFMNGFGSQTVAAISTAYRVDTVILLPINNLAAGISTIVAQNAGAGKQQRANQSLRIGAAMMSVTALVLTLVVVLFGGNMIALFGVSAECADIGSRFFRAIGRFYLIYGLSAALAGYLEGNNDVLASSVITLTALAVRVALSYLLKDHYGNMVIAYAEAYSWCFRLVVYLLRYARFRRKLRSAQPTA